MFNYVPARVRGMIGGWAEKSLSYAAKEVLLKANVQSVPTYPMSCFKLSPVVCRKLTSAVSNYWWGSSLDNHKLHWLRWEKLTRSKRDGGIGFRDFSLFNKAMLGKQGWRLITRPDSLCALVLKGKYYPNNDFLSASKKSEVRRLGEDSPWEGCAVPGDISVWADNWIPGVRSLKPLVRMPRATAERVHELFLPGTRIWDEAAVYRSFMAIDAAKVLKIKPSSRLENDVLAWAWEKNGNYSVRSAYKLLIQDQMAIAMAASGETSASGESSFWGTLWKLDVPPKIRVFWWRVLHNSLPSKSEPKRRHVEKESHCEMCGDADESLYHVFLQCPVARRFWSEVKKVSGVLVPNLHPCSWASDVLQPTVCSPSTVATVVCGAWALWTGRNARRHGRKVWEPGATARFISSLMEDLASLRVPVKQGRPVARVKWEKTELEWAKVNSDAGFNQTTCTGSAGVVIRDHAGLVSAAAARWFDGVPNALTAEALAAREGLELAVELGFDRVILEVNSQGLVNLLKDPAAIRSSIGGLCFDISELGKSFSDFVVKWVCRDANSVAHVCASTVSATEHSFFLA